MQTLEMTQTKNVEIENAVIESFRTQLKAKIGEKNLTQAEIAKILGISTSCVSRFINSNQNMTLDTLCKICYAVGCKPVITLV